MPRFVVEADGGSRGNPGPAGYGAVVLDPASGETLAERAEFIGVATNNVAEYKGLIAGLTAARDLASDAEVLVRMDSKLVVEQMSGRWKIKHPDMKPLAAEAARILPRAQVTYEWIPRERNKHADRLANEAMDAGKRGEQWEPSASSAALDASAARSLSTPPPSGPPGDAAAGAAAARAALAASRSGPDTAATAPASARTSATASALAEAAADTLWAEPGSGTGGSIPSAAPAPGRAAHAATATAPAAGQGWGPDMGAPATFVLLRHGETALTPQKRFSGSGGATPSCRRPAAARRRPSRRRSPPAAPSRRSSAPRCSAAARPPGPSPTASAST